MEQPECRKTFRQTRLSPNPAKGSPNLLADDDEEGSCCPIRNNSTPSPLSSF